MKPTDTTIAVYTGHRAAELAIGKLTENGFKMKNISIIGRGYHSENKVVGFYNAGNRIKFWGTRGLVWGGLWGLFFGGLFITIPVVGHVIVLGYLSALVLAAVESAVVVGGMSVLGAVLYSIGIPKHSIVQYETDVRADSFLVMAHGTSEDMIRAKEIMSTSNPSRLDVYVSSKLINAVNQRQPNQESLYV
jgi:hypothetical protein